jgi:hypothetical protein
MRALIAASVLALATIGVARAEGVGGGLNIGTLGAGGQLVFALKDGVSNLRVGANGWKLTYDFDVDDLKYTSKVKMANIPVIVDWFPSPGGIFRISGGLFGNQSKLDFDARADSGVFTIGNNNYSAPEVGNINGSVKYRAIAPYVGVGWGNAVAKGKNWSWNVDVGLLYQGTPKTSYSITCGTAVSAARCAQLQADAAIERDDFNREMRRYRLYPVAQFWVGKQF